mgnify:CR=1 FL=1|jgi:hypothetical protein
MSFCPNTHEGYPPTAAPHVSCAPRDPTRQPPGPAGAAWMLFCILRRKIGRRTVGQVPSKASSLSCVPQRRARARSPHPARGQRALHEGRSSARYTTEGGGFLKKGVLDPRGGAGLSGMQ